MVTMSQKSSVPQAVKSVSQALMPDNVGWIATAVMAAASAVMFISAFIGGST
jgi:hypothetical protein